MASAFAELKTHEEFDVRSQRSQSERKEPVIEEVFAHNSEDVGITPQKSVEPGNRSIVSSLKISNSSSFDAVDAPPQSALVRLFQSDVFNMTLALSYFHKTKDEGVLQVLANRMFTFDNKDVDFYLAEVVNLFCYGENLSKHLLPYLEARSKEDIRFALNTAWLIGSISKPTNCPNQHRFRKQILTETLFTPMVSSGAKKTHRKARSDVGLKHSTSMQNFHKEFDNGCVCFEKPKSLPKCSCSAPKLHAQIRFTKQLLKISRELRNVDSRTAKLSADVSFLNQSLPARVWLPVVEYPHVVVRIPASAAIPLNSSARAPYMLHVEVVKVNDILRDPIPKKMFENHRLESQVSQVSPTSNDRVSECEVASEPAQSPEVASLLSFGSGLSQDRQVHLNAGDIRRKLMEARNDRHKNFVSSSGSSNDPSAAVLKQTFARRIEKMREASPYSNLEGWTVVPVIVKAGDDLRHEHLAQQLMMVMLEVWTECHVTGLWLKPYHVSVVNEDCGFIAPIMDTVSLHQVKSHTKGASLLSYYLDTFGDVNCGEFHEAQMNFLHSCAAYSIVCYVLQVKDRHNSNILVDSSGHIIHIDFAFFLTTAPGKNLGFESSPFKMTSEYVELLGGPDSDLFRYFSTLILKGMLALRKHEERLTSLINVMSIGDCLPCFQASGGKGVSRAIQDRLMMGKSDQEVERRIDKLIQQSLNSVTTIAYDVIQRVTNGIAT